MNKRYAQGTTVSVQSSRGEITGILAKHGVVSMMWGTEPSGDVLQFTLDGRAYRFGIARPSAVEVRARDGKDYSYPQNVDWEQKAEHEWRRRWRATVLLLKAKLEFVESGDSTMGREFMPYLVTATGMTLGEIIERNDIPLLEAGA